MVDEKTEVEKVDCDPVTKFQMLKELTDGLFRKLLGLLLVCGGGAFLWRAAFPETGESKFIGEVVGFVMGTAITLVLNFFFGTSQGSSEKSKQIKAILNGGAE